MNNSTLNSRISIADALRGLAIGGIVLMHSSEYFNMSPGDDLHYTMWCDDLVKQLTAILFSGKMYGIFALLFGLSFFIMNDNQQRKGKPFLGRFAWRMVLLMGFGLLNTVFYDGDILFTYAYLGLLMIPVSTLSTKWATVIAIILFMQPIEIYSAITGWKLDPNDVWAAFGQMEEAHHTGSFFENAWANLKYGQWASFLWFIMTGRLTQTLGLFILGMIIGRKRLFYDEGDNVKRWKIILLISICMFFVTFYLETYPILSAIVHPIQNLSIIMGIVSLCTIIWFHSRRVRSWGEPLCIIGKMSMTNYFIQSVVGSFFMCGYGLGLYREIGVGLSVSMGLCLVILQYVFCLNWLDRYPRGPMETIWRKLTWINSK